MNPQLRKRIQADAVESGASQTAVINIILQKYYTTGIFEDSLLIAKLNFFDGKLNKLISEYGLLSKFLMDFFRYCFLFFPHIPDEAKPAKYKAADGEFQRFMLMFRKRLLKNMPSLEETLFPDSPQENLP
jgi:hypothetical protein